MKTRPQEIDQERSQCYGRNRVPVLMRYIMLGSLFVIITMMLWSIFGFPGPMPLANYLLGSATLGITLIIFGSLSSREVKYYENGFLFINNFFGKRFVTYWPYEELKRTQFICSE